MKGKRCLIWTTAVIDLFNPNKVNIGGFSIQMYIWAEIFKEKYGTVYTLRGNNSENPELGYKVLREMNTNFATAFLYLFYSLWIILKVRPNIIVTRGGKNRNLFFISFWCRLFLIKHIHFMGSDKDLTYEYSSFSDRINKMMFRVGLKMVKWLVVQNNFQRNEVEAKLGKNNTLLIPNVWTKFSENKELYQFRKKDFVLWVGNIIGIKRPLMYIEIAKKFPEYDFVMIGGNQDSDLYSSCMELANRLPNLFFLGKKDFFEVNMYFKNAKVFICTSEYEGFPNTFLQSWSNNLPVISTVDPSNVIKEHGLGFFCNDTNDICDNLSKILSNDSIYKELSNNVKGYFERSHSVEYHFNRLSHYLGL